MKIVILAYNAHSNCAEGVARIHFNMYSALKHIGIETKIVSIIDTKFENTFTSDFLYVSDNRHELYIPSYADKTNNRDKVLTVIKRSFLEDFDFVIDGLSGVEPSIWLRILKVINFKKSKLVESLFSRPFRFVDKWRYALPLTHKVFTYSPSEYRYLSRIFPFLSSKISLIPPLIDTDHFIKRNRRKSLSIFGLDELEDRILVGYVGNPFPDRFPLLEVFKALVNLIPKHDIAFIGVFPPYKGRTFSKTFYKIAKLFDLEKRVFILEEFIDYRHRPFLYSAFDVLLHLYRWKEAPYPFLTALEALSVGTPVITTNYNEIHWALGRIKYPLFIDLAKGITSSSIKDALEACFNQKNTEEMNLLLTSIRTRIVKTFSYNSVGATILRVLRDQS